MGKGLVKKVEIPFEIYLLDNFGISMNKIVRELKDLYL